MCKEPEEKVAKKELEAKQDHALAISTEGKKATGLFPDATPGDASEGRSSSSYARLYSSICSNQDQLPPSKKPRLLGCLDWNFENGHGPWSARPLGCLNVEEDQERVQKSLEEERRLESSIQRLGCL